MFDRDNHYLDKIARLIAESPGISMAQLTRRTIKLTKSERRGYIERLLATGRIRWDEVEGDRGKASWCFWPATPQRLLQPATPADEIEAALELAKQQLEHAKALLADATHNVNEAFKVVGQLHALPETVAQAGEPASGVETATSAEGEMRVAG